MYALVRPVSHPVHIAFFRGNSNFCFSDTLKTKKKCELLRIIYSQYRFITIRLFYFKFIFVAFRSDIYKNKSVHLIFSQQDTTSVWKTNTTFFGRRCLCYTCRKLLSQNLVLGVSLQLV